LIPADYPLLPVSW